MLVVIFHFNENLAPAVAGWLPSIVSLLFGHGNLGVPIFFVLSGFVIASSVERAEMSWRYLGRFGLRRSIRLDPPLWATIGIEVLLVKISLMLFPSLATPLPTLGQLAANVTYTQMMLGIPDIVPVFWSLTYEVQFYLVLVGGKIALHLAQLPKSVKFAIGAVMYAYSLAVWIELLPTVLTGLFIDRWFQFALGIAAWTTFQKQMRGWQFASLLAVTCAALLIRYPTDARALTTLVSVSTSIALAGVGLTGRMGSVLSGPVIQFLGRISYSLYLIHLSVGWRFISLVKMKMGPELGPVVATGAFLGGIGLSILAAWIMHALIEAPSIRLARRVALPKRAFA